MSHRIFSQSDKQFLHDFSHVILLIACFAAGCMALASYIYSQQPDRTADNVAKTTQQRLTPVAAVYARDTSQPAKKTAPKSAGTTAAEAPATK